MQGEVDVLINPSAFLLKTFVTLMSGANYSFIAFSGHGEAVSEEENRLYINGTETISSRDLITAASKQTLVRDCCRVPVAAPLIEAATVRVFKAERNADRLVARQRFDQHLTKCLPFNVVLNSCAIGQTAGENEQSGGYYTGALIRAAQQLPAGLVLGVREAHSIAKDAVTRRAPRQTPMAELPRSNPTFPFGVGL